MVLLNNIMLFAFADTTGQPSQAGPAGRDTYSFMDYFFFRHLAIQPSGHHLVYNTVLESSLLLVYTLYSIGIYSTSVILVLRTRIL